jgi:hypothetical protein
VQCGDFTAANAGITFDATVTLIGGGADGRVGIDGVLGGWISNISRDGFTGFFTDATGDAIATHSEASIWVDDTSLATGTAFDDQPAFLPSDPDPTPHVLAPPLLDSGGPTAGTGGNTASLHSSTVAPGAAAAVGQLYEISAVDAPSDSESLQHVAFPGAVLTSLEFQPEFTVSLVFWTHNAPGLYGVLEQIDWVIDGAWRIDAAGLTSTPTATELSRIRTVTSSPLKPVSHGGVVDLEVRAPPTSLDNIARNARM